MTSRRINLWTGIIVLFLGFATTFIVSLMWVSSFNPPGEETGIDTELLMGSLICSIFPIACYILFIYSIVQFVKANRVPHMEGPMEGSIRISRVPRENIEIRLGKSYENVPEPRMAPAPPSNMEEETEPYDFGPDR